MLLTPGLIAVAMTIAATRMHRSLVNLAYGLHDWYGTLNFLSFSYFAHGEQRP
jgi:hypothetical protein